MVLEDNRKTEVGVAATAGLVSPTVRHLLRQGTVYGLAGVLMMGEAMTEFAKDVGRSAQQAALSARRASKEASESAQQAATDSAAAAFSRQR